jgi:hypothetical protein
VIFKVFMALAKRNYLFLDVTSCNLVKFEALSLLLYAAVLIDSYRRFGVAKCRGTGEQGG